LRLQAVVIILRKDQVFDTGNAIIRQNHGGFGGFPVAKVPAYYRSNKPVDGYGVGLVLEKSQADIDFGVPILFLREEDVRVIDDAFHMSDQLTFRLLGRSWGGARPVNVSDFM